MLWEPMASADTVADGAARATWPRALRGSVARVAVPSENATVPVGVGPPAAGATARLNVTIAPKTGAAGVAVSETTGTVLAGCATVNWRVPAPGFVLVS